MLRPIRMNIIVACALALFYGQGAQCALPNPRRILVEDEIASETKWIIAGKEFKDDLGSDRYFRGLAKVDEGLIRATANVWIDDFGKVSVDGVEVAGTVTNADWTPLLASPGSHVISVHGRNDCGAGGVCLAVDLEYEDGRRGHVHTSSLWEASRDGVIWSPANVVCDVTGGTWPRHRDMSAFMSCDERRTYEGKCQKAQERVHKVLASLEGREAPTCRVIYDKGLPRFAVGDRLLETTYYNMSEGWWGESPELRRQIAGFRDAGMHLYGLGCAIEEVWRRDGTIDFEKLVESMRGVLAIDPDAHFMFCFAQVIAPKWWVEAHPDELVGYAGGMVDPAVKSDIKNVATASMASEVWRKDFSDFLDRAIRHLEGTPFANRIISYRIDYGIHHEWHYYGMRDRLFPDNGKAMTAAFRRWTGDPNAKVPGVAERSATPVAGYLRDPVKQARVIAYERCHAAVVRDCVLAVNRTAKEACGGRCLVGNYCGYFFGMGANPAEGWHLENDAILDSPYVDFQASPQVYGLASRNPGNPQYARALIEGLRRRGKVLLLEADNSPARAKISYCSFSRNQDEDEALYARDFAQSLCWGCGFWYFDFGNGWYGSDFNEFFRRIYPIRSRVADSSSIAEVLYVGDYESVMFSAVPGKGQERTNAATTQLITALGHTGVPFDSASMKDLMSGKLKDYRVYVFGNLHYLTREKLATVKRLRERGVSLVFIGKESGLLTSDGVSPETAAKLQSWGRVAETGKGASYWKRIFRECGVHVYNEDESAAFYANAGHVALHVGTAGRHCISLPRQMDVTELYPERKKLGAVSAIGFESTGAQTFIFSTEAAGSVETDDESGLSMGGVTVNGCKAYEVERRVEPDGVAIRYRLPDGRRVISGEDTEWKMPLDAIGWYQEGPGSYENLYTRKTVRDIPIGTRANLPITFRLPDGTYRLITEANLVDYTDLAVEYVGDGRFRAFYYAEKGEPFEQTGTDTTPWRLTIIAKDLNALVNSDLIRRLCPPPIDAKAISLSRPGRCIWQWLPSGDPKYAEQRDWYDRTRDLGFEYYLIDDGWKNWRDGGKDQWECLKSAIDYGKSVGVKTVMWVDSKEMPDAESRRAYLTKVVETGAVGIKIDFIPHCDSKWCKWYEETLRDTAEFGLFVDFHGAVKPTGRERTWPHELAREAIRGHEWHITRYNRVLPPEHDTILPFCRFVQGHGDYTPVVFQADQLIRFTWPRQLAQGVVMACPFLCFGDYPKNYQENPMLEILRKMPSTYDETVILSGSAIGECVAMARRRGSRWFVAVENAAQERVLDLRLGFLGDGRWRLVGFKDDPNGRLDACVREERTVRPSEGISITVRPCGGYIAMLENDSRAQ